MKYTHFFDKFSFVFVITIMLPRRASDQAVNDLSTVNFFSTRKSEDNALFRWLAHLCVDSVLNRTESV